ncbi:PilZ domain-containing protein [Massilia sp. LXY-6]|uniref:PilZ domain-containing protein n=1 Tax=Massilia sp. LXY-6 TaxID=3379823 RepID=UPI003EDFD342
MKEQRAHGRKLMHEQAYLADASMSSWVPVILIDISLSGISFASPAVLIDGGLRELHFRMPGSPRLHRALIHIVHNSTSGVPVGFKVGASFEEIGAETRDAIAGFLSKPVS